MSESEATGRIRIIKTPQGEAPEEIRRAWVGCILPCYPYAGHLPAAMIGVLSGEVEDDVKSCGCAYEHYVVPQAEAIAELERHAPEAAAWWNAHGYPHPFYKEFAFRIDEGEIVNGVTILPIRP